MKYQVPYEATIYGEMAIEADTPEEAKEIAREALDSVRVNDEFCELTNDYVAEPYEWDEAAQERNRQSIKKLFERFDKENKAQ